MISEIRIFSEKKLIGISRKMSYSNNTTKQLWQSFMPLKKHIKHTIGSDLYSMQIYNSAKEFNNLSPQSEFTKWAAIEVSNFDFVPDALETYILKGGLYAVFVHKGLPSEFKKTFDFIFNNWLPKSDYELDDREHFELLGNKYSNTDSNSEEEIWIPIKSKK
tara:strand:+ start:1682 stop:2167 length:486 start_codon:yes stop_codon:yes gene_type:complete